LGVKGIGNGSPEKDIESGKIFPSAVLPPLTHTLIATPFKWGWVGGGGWGEECKSNSHFMFKKQARQLQLYY